MQPQGLRSVFCVARSRSTAFCCAALVVLVVWFIYAIRKNLKEQIWLNPAPNPRITFRRSPRNELELDFNKYVRQIASKCFEGTDFLVAEPMSCNGKQLLVVIVISECKNINRRQIIRKYLLSKDLDNGDSMSWKVLFLLAKTGAVSLESDIQEEIKQHGDVLLGNFNDVYPNLVYKTIMGMAWTYCKCSTEYVLKTDDDVFLNIWYLLQWIRRSAPEKKVYLGIRSSSPHPKVVRNPSIKHFVPWELYNRTTFPEFVIGAGYLLSKDVFFGIVPLFANVTAFPVEDAYISVLAEMIHVKPTGDKRFYRKLEDWKLCEYEHVFLSHNPRGEDTEAHYRRSREAKKLCKSGGASPTAYNRGITEFFDSQ